MAAYAPSLVRPKVCQRQQERCSGLCIWPSQLRGKKVSYISELTERPMRVLKLDSLAYHETRFILSLIFKNFDFEATPEGADWVDKCEHYFFWHKPPLPVKLKALK